MIGTPPLNWNLNNVALPTQASATTLRKVLFISDSQGEQNEERIGGWFPWRVGASTPITALGAYNIPQNGVGIYNDVIDVDGSSGTHSIASVSREPGDNWPAGASTSGFHGGYSREIAITGANVPNNESLHRIGLRTPATGAISTIDLDSAWSMVQGYLNDSNTIPGVGFREFRSGVNGNTTNAGASDGNGDTDGNFDGAGGLGLVTAAGDNTIEATIREAGAGGFGTEGAEPVGIDFITRGSSGDEEDLYLQLVHSYFKLAAAGAYPTYGLNFHLMFQGGYSFKEHLDNIDNAARGNIVSAMNGADVVVWLLGHNQETSGTRPDNFLDAVSNMNARHTGGSYSTPDHVYVAPWYSPSAGGWDAQAVDAMFEVCKSNGHGFINLFEKFNRFSPGQQDGYTMDGSDLHPANAATARLLTDAILEEMQESNWVTRLSGDKVGRRARARRGGKGRNPTARTRARAPGRARRRRGG